MRSAKQQETDQRASQPSEILFILGLLDPDSDLLILVFVNKHVLNCPKGFKVTVDKSEFF
jgi:hypothetical protein